MPVFWEIAFGTVIALSVLIVFHEFGHFYVARRAGIGVLRFSVGFGPVLLNWKDRHGTNFSLALLPLGGYVQMVDEREFPAGLPEGYQGLAFNRKSIGQRAAVILAGPLANLLLAFFLLLVMNNLTQRGAVPVIAQPPAGTPAAEAGMRAGQEIVGLDGAPVRVWHDLGLLFARRIGDTGWLRFSVREPGDMPPRELRVPIERWLADVDASNVRPSRLLGIVLDRPLQPLPIQRVLPGSPAERAGLLRGDLVLGADGVQRSAADWVAYIQQNPFADIQLDIRRDAERLSLPVRLDSVAQADGSVIGHIGVALAQAPLPASMLREYRLNPWQALLESAIGMWRLTAITVSTFGKLLTGALSLEHLSGPVGIAQAAGATFSAGAGTFLFFMALLSVSLGIVNLLPIPVLDGGHLLFLLGEWARGRPLSIRAQNIASLCGMVFIVSIMLVTTYQDLLRW